MARSQKPQTHLYQLLRTTVEDAMNVSIPLRDKSGTQRYGEATIGVGTRYKYKSPEALRGINNIRIRIQDAFEEINKEKIEKIVSTYKIYVKAENSVARGESDPNSLINALEIVQDTERKFDFRIYVVNRAWLYQEWGFDMKGKLPPREVAEKILQWAIDKGIVMVLRSRASEERDTRGKKRYKIALKQRQSRYYERVDYEMTEEDDMEGPLESFMWYITKLVVDNNSGRNNRHLFLTTAYLNVISDKKYIMELQRKWFKEYRIISK